MAKASMNDIAKKTGFSIATVSFVLNGKADEKNISSATTESILACAEMLNYTPNYLAKSLKKGSSNVIGFLVPDIGNPFFGKLSRQIEDAAWKRDLHCMFGSTDENPEKERLLINDLLEKQVEGIILCSSDPDSELVTSLQKRNFPLVLFDRADVDRKCASVLIENKQPMREAVNMLFDEGCKRPGLLSITPDIYSLKRRIKGYKEALNAKGVKAQNNLIKTVDLRNIEEDVLICLKELLSEEVDSLVFTNNLVASNALWHLNNSIEFSKSNFKIAAFDNIELYDYISTDVISIKIPIPDIAQESINQLTELIKDNNGLRKTTILSPRIINRIKDRRIANKGL